MVEETPNKYEDSMNEVEDEIAAALQDVNGIVSHQRRLIFSLSLGVANLIERHLEKKQVLKPGARINHLWLKKKRENVKNIISRQIVSPIESIENIDRILDLAFELEKDRDDIAYGKTKTEELLKEKINLFLEIKKLVEK